MRRSFFTFFLLLISACGPSDGPLDPSEATSTDLEGYWVAEGTDSIGSPLITTFGFVNATRAVLVLPLETNGIVAPAGAPLSVVYQNPPNGLPSDQQYATYSVGGGELVQTVLADVATPPGTAYSTRILAITPRESLTLESSQASSGQRTYTWHARCPAPNEAGWDYYRAHFPGCPPAIALGNSIAFDEHGDIHAVHGVGAVTGCEVTTYTYITEACLPRHIAMPAIDSSAIDVKDGVVRVAAVLRDYRLVVYSRRLDEADFGPEQVIDAAPGTTRAMRFVRGTERPTLMWSGTTTGLDSLAHSYVLEDDGTWTKRSDEAMAYPFDSAVAANGDVYFVKNDFVHRVTQDGTPLGEPIAIPLPAANLGITTPIHVTPSGRIEIVYESRVLGENPGGSGGAVIGNEAYLLQRTGTTWTQTLLGNQYGAWIATHGDGPARVVITTAKAFRPELAMHTIEGGEIISTELLHGGGAFGLGSTPEYFHVPQAVTHDDGSVAATFDGASIYVKRGPPARRVPARGQVTFIAGEGVAHLRADDGRFDCTDDCFFDAAVGEGVLVHAEAPPGWTVSIGGCYESTTYGATSCRLLVRDHQFAVSVFAERTAVESRLTTGNMNLSSVATAFDARGSKFVVQAEFNPGVTDFRIGNTTLSLDAHSPRALVGYDRDSGDAWITPLPAAPLGLAALPDGGAWVVAAIDGSVDFGSGPVGASGEQSLVRVRYGTDGTTTDAEVIDSGSRAFFTVSRANVDADGTVAAVVRSDSDWLFVRAATDSTATETVISIAPSAGTPTLIAISGARSLVAFDSAIVLFDGATLAGVRTFGGGADLTDVALTETRAFALVVANAESDLGGMTCAAGQACVASYDDGLDLVAQSASASTGDPSALAVFEDAVIIASGGFSWAYDGDLNLTAEPVAYPSAQTLARGQSDDALLLLHVGELIELRPR